MKNKKTLGIIAAVVAVVLLIGGFLIGGYNGLVEQREAVSAAQSEVQTNLQRRADLIPNLVNTVKGYAAHEEAVFTEIADARAALSGAKTVEEMNTANTALDSALSRLLLVVENYPDLKADQQFINLQDELAGTENRIAKSRQSYNEQAKEYNTKIRRFPTSLLAGMFNFEPAAYFEAELESQTVPNVNFGA